MTIKPKIIDILAVYGLVLVYVLLSSFLFRLDEPRWINLLFPAGIAAIPLLYALLRCMSIPAIFPVVRVTRRETAGALLLVPAVLVLLIPLAAFIKPFLPEETPTDAAFIEDLLSGGFAYAFFFIVVFPAVTEEILFRGFILSGLRANTGKWPAIVICSLLFASLHLEPLKIVFTVIPGFVITVVAWETRSLVLPVIMHSLHNGILFYVLWKSVFNIAFP